MSYLSLAYFAVFLPVFLIIYQISPQKYRWCVLLAANYVFFFIASRFLVLWIFAETFFTFLAGKKLGTMKRGDMDRKAFKKKKSNILKYSVIALLAVLIALKYTNFFGKIIFSAAGKTYHPLNILVPIGISYYTLMGISYLVDVKNGKYACAEHFGKFALYMSFFPTIMEGPIARWNDYGPQLSEGKPVTAENLAHGYERILWGLFKKLTIADHLAVAVSTVYSSYPDNGAMVLFVAVACTLQLYMDFAGSIDVVIGTGEILGITIPENFRQPFFAKDAGDFWRRWHISLGAFMRDYIFYPVSLSKPVMKLSKWTKAHVGNTAARFIGPVIALLLVWLSNGFWHGPNVVYILYGIYYFFFMSLELFIKAPLDKFYEKHNITDNTPWLKVLRFFKMAVIVCYGEMFFAAETLSKVCLMTKSIFTNFQLRIALHQLTNLGMDSYDFIQIFICFLPVIIVDVMAEKGINLKEAFDRKPLIFRWTLLLLTVFAVVMFGAYGPGYGTAGMMYAGF